MKAVLCNPPQPVSFFPKIPPLGIAYLGALLRHNGHDVILHDFNIQLGPQFTGDDICAVAQKIASLEPDVVGISCWAMCMPFVSEFVSALKREYDGIVGLGGPYPSLTPVETLQHIEADFCVVGEGELPLCDIAKDPEKFSTVDNVCFRSRDTIICNQNRSAYYPLDDLPYPALDLLPPIEMYQSMQDDYWYMEEPRYEFPIMGSRGCAYKCAFCSTRKIWKQYRRRNPKDIVKEISRLVKEYGDIFIDFQDDMFTLSKSWVTSICNHLLKEHVEITWSCCTRVDCVSDTLLDLMKEAGCTNIDLGIESINDHVLQYIRKGYTAKDVKKGLSIIINHGIHPETTYIVNLPVETKEDIIKTIEFGEKSLKEGVSEVTFYLLTPYPSIDIITEHALEITRSPYWENLLSYVALFSSHPHVYDDPFWLPEAFTIANPHLSEDEFWEIFERIDEINKKFPPYPLSFFGGEKS